MTRQEFRSAVVLLVCLVGAALASVLLLIFVSPAHADDNSGPIGYANIYRGEYMTLQSWCISPNIRWIEGYSSDSSQPMRTDGLPLNDPYECSHYFNPQSTGVPR